MPSLFLSYRASGQPRYGQADPRTAEESRLPRWDIFYDHDSIAPGEPFPERIRVRVTTATVVLVVIGPLWGEILRQRKDADIDHVRTEILLALEHTPNVVPVLVGRGARADGRRFLRDSPACYLSRSVIVAWCVPIPTSTTTSNAAGCSSGSVSGLRGNRGGNAGGPLSTLTAEVGQGGMGVVYRAKQKQPVRRTVAVKLIKPGMDSRDVLARFDAERQALAVMDHPNIAKVLDAGQTAPGPPFYVIEYVRGVPITQYCDEKRLNPQERLNLFIAVCNAVQHAHQKGIIHRDLKPSNVLVEVVDGVSLRPR